MDVATETPLPSAKPSSDPRPEGWRRVVRWFGLVCLMGAAFFGGYVAWLLWGTGVETAQAQASLRAGVERAWDDPRPPPGPDDPSRIVPGDAYAIIRIASADIDFVVVQGTSYDDLKQGPGHYVDTANPWDGTGRVAIAGHRTTYQAPFNALDRVAPGDTIELVTEFGTFTYEVTRNFIIPEEGSGVVLEQTKRPTLVLTTCNPKYASYERLIVEADLVDAPA